ncbi:hypothetical protein OG730_04630 [Streptomyces sp. NBC_01298]|uniref:hypothetical protein n=1 Tax=Streptomyces sp. NBC_01298 TaxID=2903817 RepID=UPI002E0D7224|nr:hypothetical protein OG730_04630 [Streptomyces sp. NBC_01298]
MGDTLTHEALTTGSRFGVTPTGSGGLRLAITLGSGDIQHFERPGAGGPGDWTATDLEGQGGGFSFQEPVSAEWGRGLGLIANSRGPKG